MEFQYVVFQAVDRPLNDRLAFTEPQSSRADVSRCSLSCEYHYSSFHGDVDGLLRRGYDVFLQYTNYGDREIKMRLPQGLPFAKSVWSKYIDGERLEWKKDSKGSGGILSLHPYHEPADLEEVWEFKRHLDAASCEASIKVDCSCCVPPNLLINLADLLDQRVESDSF